MNLTPVIIVGSSLEHLVYIALSTGFRVMHWTADFMSVVNTLRPMELQGLKQRACATHQFDTGIMHGRHMRSWSTGSTPSPWRKPTSRRPACCPSPPTMAVRRRRWQKRKRTRSDLLLPALRVRPPSWRASPCSQTPAARAWEVSRLLTSHPIPSCRFLLSKRGPLQHQSDDCCALLSNDLDLERTAIS